jgi:hypothetical protein
MTVAMDILDVVLLTFSVVLVVAAVAVIGPFIQFLERIAEKRGHPQAAVAGSPGVVIGGLLWLVAKIWTFLNMVSNVSTGSPDQETRR